MHNKMTKCDINLLYTELNKLLEDICEFLEEELQQNGASPKKLHNASQLIERSKKQLTTIAKISMNPDNDSGRYVDMRPNKKEKPKNPAIADDSKEIYSAVDDDFADLKKVEYQLAQCPYDNFKAQDFQKYSKHGYLERKEKFLFIGHQKKLYAGIHNSWMLIYNTEKDCKPIETINLALFNVRENNDKDKKHVFELVSRSDSKMFVFTATTKKDVLQWIAAIESPCCHLTKTTVSFVDFNPAKSNVCKINSLNEDAEQLYTDVDDLNYDVTVNVKTRGTFPAINTPGLPPRNPKLLPVPNNIPTEDPENIYETSSERSKSFSDVDSDPNYDEVINDANKLKEKPKLKNKPVSFKDDDDIASDGSTEYDEVFSPSFLNEFNIKNSDIKPTEVTTNKPKLKAKPNIKLIHKKSSCH